MLIPSQIAFLVLIFKPWVAIACAALLAGGLVAVAGSGLSGRRIRLAAVALALAASVSLCVLGGQGHWLFANADWWVRDAVLADLSRSPWPVSYPHGGSILVLRAPIGLYVLPALVGRVFGLWWAHQALLVQDAVLLAAAFLAFTSAQVHAAGRLIIIAVFTAFSGWDLVGGLLLPLQGVAVNATPLASIAPETWGRGLQYSSLVTDLFWAPNHAIPAWIMLAAYVGWRRGRVSAAALAALSAFCLLWSPLAVMGAAPFVVLALVADLRRGRLRPWQFVGLAIIGVAELPVLIYLTLDSSTVLHGWNVVTREFQSYYALFLALEVLPLLYLAGRARSARRGLGPLELLIMATLLFAIPLYKIGFSNDFMMRASIFPISLAALLAAERLVEDVRARRWRVMAPAVAVLFIGSATPALQIARVLLSPAHAPRTLDLPHAWAASPFSGQEITPYLVAQTSYARWGWLLRVAGAAPRPPILRGRL